MTSYSFVTIWEIEAPVEKVWEVVLDMETWPQWWPLVKSVAKLGPGDANGIGSRWHFVYASRLPYTLEFDSELTRVEPPCVLEGATEGELAGIGRWHLSQEGTVTRVRYVWNVESTIWWMNLLAPVMRPLFSWNHAQVMKQGAEGMAAHLCAKLVRPASHPKE